MLHVVVTSPERLLFDGAARSVIFPGNRGTFEVLPHHRPLVSLLQEGIVSIDGKCVRIRGGVMRVAENEVTAVVEPQGTGGRGQGAGRR